MKGRRWIYLISLLASLVFYVAYKDWLSFLLFVFLLALPWFSLICSLPAMLSAKVQLNCPNALEQGQAASIGTQVENRFPPVPVGCRMEVTNTLTGETLKVKNASTLPTAHCGRLKIRIRRGWIYDYSGLLRFPLRSKDSQELLIRPVPLPVTLPDANRCMANAWRPKPGGGFAENHELRLYRPGDNLHQIHWKLSAKTGKLILREPMERVQGLALLTMELRGAPEQLDQMLGQLLSASRQLIAKDIPHQIHCLTAEGLEVFHVVKDTDILPALDALLRASPAPEDAHVTFRHAPWRFHIGGDCHEN